MVAGKATDIYSWAVSGVDELHAELILDGVADGTYNVSVYYKYNDFIKSIPIQVNVAESQGGPL